MNQSLTKSDERAFGFLRVNKRQDKPRHAASPKSADRITPLWANVTWKIFWKPWALMKK